jgi:hypothetical protein
LDDARPRPVGWLFFNRIEMHQVRIDPIQDRNGHAICTLRGA